MKNQRWISVAVTMFATWAMALCIAAQDNPTKDHKHHQYKLYDLGTFGGPSALPTVFAVSLSNAGMMIGAAQTPDTDPYAPHCLLFECFITHAFQWQKGVLTDLGALPGPNSSYAFEFNDRGDIVGISENGLIDPDTGYPEAVAVLWDKKNIVNLGTLGGTQSSAPSINNRGQVVGWAMNTIPDPYSADLESTGPPFAGSFPGTTQLRAALWDNHGIHDLGTLGGPSALAVMVNQRGQIAGQSYTSFTPNPTTGIPTIDAFLWENGKMKDLGSLGGTITYPVNVNSRGQVVGTSDLPGDQSFHGFVWDRGVLTDLSLGGSGAVALWNSDSGDVGGGSFLPGDQVFHAFLWSRGVISDLGTVGGDPCSVSYSVNSNRQAVGYSGLCDESPLRAFLWENGGPMVDLNALVEPPSDLYLYVATYLNDRGEIVALGITPEGGRHVVLLKPHGSCDDACEQRIADHQYMTPLAQPAVTGASRPAFGKSGDWLRARRVGHSIPPSE